MAPPATADTTSASDTAGSFFANGNITGDSSRITADAMQVTADGGGAPPAFGGLGRVPPSVIDRESAPTADDLLPQIAGVLTPRGPAWGTDEVGDGSGASPVQQRFWRGLAAWTADHLGLDWSAATQALPSAITYTLTDWETELGLPDPCGGPQDTPGRIMAVRARFGAIGGVSPAYYTYLAEGAGYTVTVEEPTQFRCDVSPCVGPSLLEIFFRCDDGVCDGDPLTESYFRCDDGVCDGDPIEGFVAAVPGGGDPLESYALPPADGTGDQVAGLGPFETFFRCDDSACDDDPVEGFSLDDPEGTQSKYFVIHLPSGGDTLFRCDDSECGDPVEGFVAAPGLECQIRAHTPPHAAVVFAYDAVA